MELFLGYNNIISDEILDVIIQRTDNLQQKFDFSYFDIDTNDFTSDDFKCELVLNDMIEQLIAYYNDSLTDNDLKLTFKTLPKSEYFGRSEKEELFYFYFEDLSYSADQGSADFEQLDLIRLIKIINKAKEHYGTEPNVQWFCGG